MVIEISEMVLPVQCSSGLAIDDVIHHTDQPFSSAMHTAYWQGNTLTNGAKVLRSTIFADWLPKCFCESQLLSSLIFISDKWVWMSCHLHSGKKAWRWQVSSFGVDGVWLSCLQGHANAAFLLCKIADCWSYPVLCFFLYYLSPWTFANFAYDSLFDFVYTVHSACTSPPHL